MESKNKNTKTGKVFPDWRSVSPKQTELNNALLSRTTGKVKDLLVWLLDDQEIDHYHSWANVVSVRRLGYNDHGPVHARISTYNALKILSHLEAGGCSPSLVKEEVGTMEDAQIAQCVECFRAVTRHAQERDLFHAYDHCARRSVRFLASLPRATAATSSWVS